MKLALIIAGLIVAVVLLEKYHKKLPKPFQQLHRLWNCFAHKFGMVMSWLILTIFWIFGIGSYGIVMKIIKLFRSRKKPESYYIDTGEHGTMSQQF